jgi:ornithine--oxo-acid transaminase
MNSLRHLIHLEKKFVATTIKPLNLVIARGKGPYLYDINKKRYLDFLCGFSAANQGHSHPEIIKEAKKQLDRVTITSRSVHTDKLSLWSEYVCNYFNYDRVLPMNSGAEAVETAIKLARRYGYLNKSIEPNKAKIITFNNNFHGRTIGVISASTNESYKENFGPYSDGFIFCDYNNLESVRNIISNNPDICAILIEPIQGEGGIQVPDNGYLYGIKKLCDEKNILLVGDEIQSGLGRTGKMLCFDYDNIKPDILILAKSLSGGVVPISCILSSDKIMSLFSIGSHGSTFGGNPFACAVSMKALEVIKNEGLVEKSYDLGQYFRNNIAPNPLIKEIRGKGLFNGIEFNIEELNKRNIDTYSICEKILEHGVISKNANNNVVRFTPPLIIKKSQLTEGLHSINRALNELL